MSLTITVTVRSVIIPDVRVGTDVSFPSFGYEFPMDDVPVRRDLNADGYNR